VKFWQAPFARRNPILASKNRIGWEEKSDFDNQKSDWMGGEIRFWQQIEFLSTQVLASTKMVHFSVACNLSVA
jgi:hypothetical protein